MNSRIVSIAVFIFLFSCQNENVEILNPEDFSQEISFTVSEIFQPGIPVKWIELTEDGYYYCSGKTIFFVNSDQNRKVKSFESESDITCLEYNLREKSLYFGTASNGLGKYDGNQTKYYTSENAGLPRNYISHVACDNNGNTWFSSSVHMEGGLVKYNGSVFAKYLPENSPLPDNLVHQVICKNNSIYVVSDNPDKLGTIVSKITGNKWNKIFESGGCSINSMDIDSNGDIYYISDGREYCGGGLLSDEVVFSFSNQQKTVLREYEESMDLPYLVKVDKRNYVWVAKYPLHMGNIISVFDGEKWNKSPENFPEVSFYCIEVDDKNNIWLGTSDGIYILNQ
jgi:ligand-binding sensor domain-containing protein